MTFPLLEAVPFARTLGITFSSVSPTSAVAVLADDPRFHNHIGGPHAGAQFTLAETASGAIILAAFSSVLDRVTPLTVSSSIRYNKVAFGDMVATATLVTPAPEVIAALEAGSRPEFDVLVQLATAAGKPTGEMTVTWTLRPNN